MLRPCILVDASLWACWLTLALSIDALAFESWFMKIFKHVGSHWLRASQLIFDFCILVYANLQACRFMLVNSMSFDVYPLHLDLAKSSSVLVHVGREHLSLCLIFIFWFMQVSSVSIYVG